MGKRLTILLALLVIGQVGFAQQLKLYQLMQVFKLYQLDNSIHIAGVSDCLRAYDKSWVFMETMTERIEGQDAHFWYYSPEKILEPKHIVMASTSTNDNAHYLEYQFDDSSQFQAYQTQILNMNPEDGGASKVEGGTGRIYYVGKLALVLRSYPAGIKAEHAVYSLAVADNIK